MTHFQHVRRDEQLDPGQGAFVVDPSPLLGEWINTNHATTGIARVTISRAGDDVAISVWPADMPRGRPRHRATAASVYANGPNATAAMALSAAYEDEHEDATLEANLSLGLLVIAMCHTFKSCGGRSNYFSREFFHYAEDPYELAQDTHGD